ncbi:MAG: uroporphyrinogen decarboxylase family protein [Sedimentisphaerales bacterium]|nr:uroporphyrinogen decarboxylase family protein [Sedimentisphaerales bacterium]
MNEKQWSLLLDVINGKTIDPLPVGFIIDSPWLPGWAGISILDYFSSEKMWLDANMKAIKTFPDAMFLPGFWSEYGMCTEPSAFGSKCSWKPDEFPFALPVIKSTSEIDSITKPDPSSDGMLPFVISRLKHSQKQIEKEGHAIRFAVARGPLNIASFLMGTTELLMGTQLEPDKIKSLLDIITDFLVDWIKLQAQVFPTIDGIFLLDDIVGFVGEQDFLKFARPYLQKVYNCLDVSVRFFHNDAPGLVCAPHLADIGINLFNFSSNHDIVQMRRLVGDKVTLLGNIPPRDVLAAGTPDDVRAAAKKMLEGLEDRTHLIASCGGGVPQNVSTENINAFIEAIQK